MNNFSKVDDLRNERKRFTEENFSADAQAGGLLLFPNTYNNINQVKTEPWVVDAEQMAVIRKNVFEYFMVNEDILTNKAYGDSWIAFYGGAVEPFAIQFSEVVTKMLYTFNEQSRDNQIIATTNRLEGQEYIIRGEYWNATEKINGGGDDTEGNTDEKGN